MTKEKMKNPERLSIVRFIFFMMWASIIAIIGVSLPETINFINGNNINHFHGYFASYVISAILFWAGLEMSNFQFFTNTKPLLKIKIKK